MRFKLAVPMLLLLSIFVMAENRVMLLVDNHFGFDGKATTLQIFDKWCEIINNDLDRQNTSSLSNTKFSIYMIGAEGLTDRETFRFPIDPPLDMFKKITKGDRQRHADSLIIIRNDIISFIDSSPKTDFIDLTKALNTLAMELALARKEDLATIFVVSNYEKLPKNYDPVKVTEFEEAGIPTRLYFTNVEDWKNLLNVKLRWDKDPSDVFEALRCYSSGEFK
ncbi:hypothetical protein DRQ36_01695 [bacterium]|nr:MAG: hypothetical protein DRQ36_01695 [bacterium]